MKKRHILLGLLALEIASIPAAAQIIDKVVFSVPQKATHIRLSAEPGLTKFVIASNAPFAITSEGAIGDFGISIHKSGFVNGKRFGDNAQMPGEAQGCAVAISTSQTKLYEAERKTAAQKGGILTQSVIVEVRYDPALEPTLHILTQKNAKGLSAARNCDATTA